MMPEATVSNEESAYRAKYYNGITSVRRGDLFCSSCGNTISFEADTFYSHPFLGILQCQACSDSFRSFKSKVSAKAWKRRCLMCGSDNCQTLFPCPVKGCPYSFCKNCIKRNASSALLLADTPNWKCFVCMTNPLWQARGICDTLLSASPRRKKKKKTVREESSDEDYLDNIKAKMASEKRPRVLRKSVTKPSSDAPTRRPTRNASKTTVNQIEDSDDNLEIVSVKKSKKSFKLKTSTTSKRKPSSERSSVERSSSPESSGRHSKLSTTEPVRRTRGASSDSRKGSTKGITQSCQKVKRQNSDSSSGKEFTQTKLIRESYVPLQRLSIGEKDFTHPPDEPGSPEGTILTKQQMFSLKNSIQDFINNLKSTSKKMIHVAESLQRQYSQKEMIRPAEATKWIAECKTTASAFTKKINNNEHALVDRFDSWCKKYKVKNIFISANGIDDSDSPLRSGFDTLRTRKQVKSSNVIPSSDEEDEDNVRSKGQASSVEKTPDVSECEIAEIFSQDETHPSRSTDKILSPVREEIGTGDIESPESSSARLSRSPEVVDGAEARGAEKVNSRGSSEDIFADFECEAKEQGKIKTERKSKEREVASSNDEISSPGPKSSKKSRKSREKKENSRKESLEHLPLSDSGSEEKNVKGEEKNFKESEKKKNRILSSSGDSDDDASSKMRANTASPRSSEGKKKSKSEMKKRRKNSSSIKNSGSSSDERKNKSQDSSADDQRLMKSTKKKNKKSNLVSSNLNQSEDEKIDDGIESRSSEARAREALLESDSSENQEEITANSSDKSTDQAGPSIEEDNSLQSIVESPAKNTKSKKSKSSIQQEDSSPDTHSKKKKRKRSLSSTNDSIELPEESATEQPLSFEASNTDHQTNNSQENSDGSFMTANDEVCSTQLTVKRDNSKDSAAELSQHSNISNAETIIQDQLVEDSKNTPPKDVSDEQHAKQYLLQSSSDDSFNESVDESTKKGSSSEASVNEEILKKSSRTIDSLSSIDETGALDESEKSEDKRDTDAEERAKKALMTSSSDEVEMDRTVEISEPEVSHIEETTNDSPLVPEISSDKASDGPVSQGMEERAKEALLDSDCSSVDVNSGSLVESGNYSSAERPDKTRDRTEMKKTGESDSGTEAAAPYLKGKSQKSASSGSKDLEENAKKYLLNSSSDENEGSVKKKRLLTRPVDSSHHDSDSMFSSPRVKRRKLDMKKSEFFKNDEKLKLGCSVVVNRLSNVILRRHARALKKSKEYLEDKALRRY
uniref:ATRX_0 protein n=1 Tax=Fopius arisanus TaxID=64838 RepID=A0A0C9Q2U4_9HYME